MIIDVELRVEASVLELLKAYTYLTALVPSGSIRSSDDASQVAEYPAVWVQADSYPEAQRHTGWYMGSIQVGAVTYQADDTNRRKVKRIIGAVRGWAQQTDLVAQINATASATSEAAALQVADVNLSDASPYDFSDDRRNQIIFPMGIVCRPSQAATE